MSGRRKEKPPATWLRAILEEGKPPLVSEVPVLPEMPVLQVAVPKRSLIKRLIAWARGKPATG